jgi:hypothetical protein
MHTRDTHCPQVRPPSSSSSSHPLCLLSASPSRDCNQLKPNINSALDACKGLVSAFGEVIKAQHNFARSLTGLIEAQDCQIEKEIVREVQTSTVRALPLLGEIVTTLQHQVLEPLQFFEVETMSIAASSVSDINKMTPKAGKKYFQYHREAITDWNSFRRIRHDMLISSIYTFAQSSLGQVDHPLLLSPSLSLTELVDRQHNALCRSWAQALPVIKEQDFDATEFSSSIHRGWRGLVERERNELASAVNLLNES